MTQATAGTRSDLRDRLRHRLRHRRQRLATAVAEAGRPADLVRLLGEVDSALDRLETDGFDRCALCGGAVDEPDLLAHPQLRYCLCDLTPARQEALQRDLDLAWQVQAALLPQQDLSFGGWTVHYRYRPAGSVGGDYCDVITRETDGGSYFMLGDVAGKGIAAAFVMAQLNAVVRSLARDGVGVPQLVERVDQQLAAGTLQSHFATLVCGHAAPSGEIELCNAGHCRPIVARAGQLELIDATGMPVGLGEMETPRPLRLTLAPGESLVLYTDGVTETRDPDGGMYGAAALERVVAAHREMSPGDLADACLRDLAAFRGDAEPSDDLTIMVIRRLGEQRKGQAPFRRRNGASP